MVAVPGLALIASAALTAMPATAEPVVLLSDEFETGDSQWTTAGGDWSIRGPAGSRIYHQADTHRNARAFAGETGWTDVSVRAEVEPLAFDGTGLAAVLARVQDEETYYYLTLRSNDNVEINKLEDGSRTLLAGTSFPVDAGESYTLRLDVEGDQLTGYVDGEPLVSATDGQFIAGEVGLKTFNGSADFDHVEVVELEEDPGNGEPDPPDPPDGAIFHDDFSSGDDAWSTSGGSWSITDEQVYRQGSDDRNARAFAGEDDWQNITAEAEVTPLTGSGSSSLTALLGRVQGTETYYYLTLRNNGRLEINRLDDGSRTELAGTSLDVRHEQTYTLALEMWFDELTAYVDGEPVLTATDDAFPSGGIGVKTFNATAEFDDVVVTAQEDTEPPAAPADLRVTATSSSNVGLAWDPSTDDDQVAGYDIYQVGSPDELVGTTGDTALTVTGLHLDGSYEFYAVARDRAGNVSQPSEVIAASTRTPEPASGLEATSVSATSVGLEWEPSPDHGALDGYEVFQVGSPDRLMGTTGATSFPVTGLEAETTYEFYVVAVDDAGVASEPSGTVVVTTGEMPEVPPVETPIGYASLNGGTTGGFGHEHVDEVVLSEYWADSEYDEPGEALFQLLHEHRYGPEDEGLVVYVDMTIREDEFGRSKFDITDSQNVSLLGVSDGEHGSAGEFDGVGFTVRRSHNVVFRNLEFHHVSQGEGTAIEVTDDSTNLWIDHNEFYSEPPQENDDSDYYDGLIDIKRNAEYVTVSWNYLHDHWKTMLLGHTDSESLKPDKITYHHNWFRNVNSRLPLIRYAEVHMLNNYFQDVIDTAINARMGAQVLVEANYFENVGSGEPDPTTGFTKGPVGWFYGSSETGYWNLQDNVYVDTPHGHLESTTDFTVPYEYGGDAHTAEDARELVQQFAGIGVIDINP
ncbi:hypothetical protein EF847_19125 [Actinobacteria bacterium YIM 96077]|uniref:Fibronectin type-III domain-containing protein n=1 Tax=Phytoactinopolyspora halophila TaxID=1981511 RepID=A0A329QJD4_9ACTN|nr:fibronectin type III domain-containing protein [Phytoactinopolyspora halophila]AYY14490.1 hypothetical protein EF847_19125 [Actinobacteria bacterium YIM 96077]RAW11482.1 hypothetical protein DPM12_16775 [Phytoactinopolyspora halophila]